MTKFGQGNGHVGEKMTKHTLTLLFASAIVLTACGGGGGGSDTTPTPPTVTNNPPIVASANGDQTATVGTDFNYDATQAGGTFSDADGDSLSYSVSFSPEANGLSAASGVISGTPTSNITITVTITANDGNGGVASDIFDITAESAGTDQDAVQAKFQGRIDLDNLENYAGQTVPNYITKLNDGGNPITDAGATLGRILFYDKAMSIDDTVSCASCHMQSHGFSDPDVVSTGVEGGQTGRHSMRLVNMQFADETNFFWDERASSHEDQETQPLVDHNEHGFSGMNGRPGFADLVTKLEGLDYYQELFTFVYGDPEITEERLQLSLAQFTKSIFSFDSRFDEGRAQVANNGQDFPNFTAEENAGKRLFLDPPPAGGAGCAGCHQPPEFDIRPGSGHNGVFAIAGSTTEFDLTNTRSPSLRDLVDPDGNSNGPFMHDGSLDSLLDVVNHYDSITEPTTEPLRTQWRNTIDNRLLPGGNPQNLNFNDTEKAQLVAFMRTLTGSNLYTDEKWSDPFMEEVAPVSGGTKPNILLVITDDQGKDASAEYSLSTDVPNTPNFSAMARSGLIFDNAWVSPVCSPTRAALISGKFGHRTNVLAPGDSLPDTDIVLQSFLKAQAATDDYSSAMIGKWHLGGGNTAPNDFGIDYFAGITIGAVPDYFDWTLNENGTTSNSTTYATTALTDLAIDWVADQDQPWFLWLSYNAPHSPYHLPPNNLHSRTLSGDQTDIDANTRDYYLAAIEAMDSEFGRFWNSLTADEQANTVVIFIGDNGTPAAVRDRSVNQSGSKGTLLEGGVSIPMFISGAGVTRSGEREDALVIQTDLFPTIVTLAGGDLASYEDGESFVDLLSSAGDARDYAYTVSDEGFTIRNEQYKLVELTDGSQELYDLINDPDESNNLIGSSASIDAVVVELEDQAAAYRE